MKEYKQFEDFFEFLPKSKNQASIGAKIGKYPFYTSSPIISKFVDSADLNLEDSLVFGTGGNPSIHYARGGFSISTDCYAVKPKSSSVLTKFAYYYLSGNIHILENGFKGAGLKHISKSYIQEINIPIFSLPQQEKIVSVLDTASALVEKQKALLKKYDLFLKSKFIEMFGDPVKNPMGWEICKFEDLTEMITYGLTVRPDYIEQGIPLISAREIRSGKIDFTSAPKISQLDFEKLSSKAKPLQNDILFSKTGSIGHSALVKHEISFAATQNSARIVPNKSIVSSIFLLSFMRTDYFVELSKREAKGNAVQDLQLGTLKAFNSYLPPLELQKKFAQIVEQTETLKQKEQQKLEKLQTLYDALMSKAFKGEIK